MKSENEIFEVVKGIICEKTELDASEITMESEYRNDLNISSIVIVSVILAVETEFGLEISDEEIIYQAAPVSRFSTVPTYIHHFLPYEVRITMFYISPYKDDSPAIDDSDRKRVAELYEQALRKLQKIFLNYSNRDKE